MRKKLLFLFISCLSNMAFAQLEQVDVNPGYLNVSYHNETYFIQSSKLYRFDETDATTVTVGNVPFAENIFLFNDTIFITTAESFNDEDSLSIYKSDGDTIIHVAKVNGANRLYDLTLADSVFYFNLFQSSGQAFYKSDGTTAGTVSLENTYNGEQLGIYRLFRAGSTMFLKENSGRFFKYHPYGDSLELIREGVFYTDFIYSLNDVLLINSYDSNDDRQHLWSVNEEGEFTHIKVTADSGHVGNDYVYLGGGLGRVGNVLYFTLDELKEIWRTDGTQAGTYRILRVAEEEVILSIYNVGERLFYLKYIDDPGNPLVPIAELYTIEPGSETITFVKEIPSIGVSFTAVGNKLVFVAGVTQLWESDGTPEGTILVEEFPLQPDSTIPFEHSLDMLVTIGDYAYFTHSYVYDPGFDQEVISGFQHYRYRPQGVVNAIADNKVNNSFAVYPNPVSDLLHIEVKDKGAYSYQLINSIGEVVSGGTLNGGQTVGLSGESKGVYMLLLTSEKSSETRRIVVE